jgi:hypothetical protein
VPPVQYDPLGQREHDTENPVPVPTYPSIQTIPVNEILSMNDVQSPLAQLALATLINLIVTDPVEPPLHNGRLVTV